VVREELLTVVGGNFYFETQVQVRFRSDNAMALTPDAGVICFSTPPGCLRQVIRG
jgi:hypothetical protein